MLKKDFIALSLVSFLIVISLLPVVISSNSVSNRIIYVDDDGGADYTKIQDAIDNASEGDTIYVYSGTYVENLNVNMSINLIGENRNLTIIDGNNKGGVITVQKNAEIFIEGFTIQNSRKGEHPLWKGGVKCFFGDNNIIRNCIFRNNDAGVFFLWSNYNIVENCVFINNSYGIGSSSVRNEIKRNSFTGNNYGVFLYGSEHCKILNNNIIDNKYGMLFDQNNIGNIVSNNVINSNEKVGILFWDHNNVFNEILNNNISLNDEHGIYCYHWYYEESGYNNIIGNTICSNGNGIYVYSYFFSYFRSFIIADNIISSNEGRGICLDTSEGCTISGNLISNNGEEGIYINLLGREGEDKNTVYSNYISDNCDGIYIIGTGKIDDTVNEMRDNYIVNNEDKGIHIDWACSNRVVSNYISNNYDGILLEYQCVNNFIGYNNFIENGRNNAYFIISFVNIFNRWMSNYWDDWHISSPKPIYGHLWYILPIANYDWNPAQEPYDIPIPEVS